VPIRIAIADDHAIVLDGLRRLFAAEPDMEVVQCCTTGDDAVQAARRADVDVLVLDYRMPGMTGLDVLAKLANDRSSCRTVLLTAALSDDDAVEALRLGARGIVMKESAPDTLLECLRRVYRGDQWLDSETRSRAAELLARRAATASSAAQVLTARETEIVRMIARGLRNKAIAERLSISEGTVKIHLHNIYEKLGLDGRLELMLYAQKNGLG
jgi:DNA-binding NarL/FixJ family response regulator